MDNNFNDSEKDGRMTVYISGKMSGLTEEEYRKNFKDAENRLIELGYNVVNPCDLVYLQESYAGMLLQALYALSQCDKIYMLKNWKESNGANCEYWFAKGMGIDIMFEGVFDPNDFAFCLQPIDEYVVDFGDRKCHFRLIKETNFRDE